MTIPEPFIEPDPLPYVPEEDDRLLPRPGFVTDFVAGLRGVETPTIFCIWSALWALSTASCRWVYLDWLAEAPLFPNLYVFLVAPPGRCHKSTAIKYAQRLLQRLEEKFDTPGQVASEGVLKYMAHFNWATSKTTPDALYELLKPQTSVIVGSDKVVEVAKGSQLALCISELAVFLNKKKYNVGIIDTLTDLYDCQDRDIITTISRGSQELKDIFVTFIGATTPTGMKDSLPFEAFGEGFASRATIVYKEKTSRIYPTPMSYLGYPTLEDLRERMAWIMRNKLGQYTFTDDATDWFEKWYIGWRAELDADENYHDRVAEFRFDVNMKRIALLLAMGRYTTDRIIEKQDLIDAHRLLKGTYRTSTTANAEAGIAVTEFNSNYIRLANLLRTKGAVDRATLASNMSSKGISMQIVKDLLKQMHTEGKLCIEEYGTEKENLSWSKNERYIWRGK